ncbi:hypothetical protein KKF34_04905 [Myxococcota bacterium]|nr:hypothetical protein [Myxococcota bacterium]MBU1496199.1 hypothetical protein [Myxococcota bacterium]
MDIKYLFLIFFLICPAIVSAEDPRSTAQLGFDLGLVPMKSSNVVLDQTRVGIRYAAGENRNFVFFSHYNGIFGRLAPFMDDEGTSQARSFQWHNFTIGAELHGKKAGLGLAYSYKRVYNVMHPYFSTMKSFDPSDSPTAKDGDFDFSTVDIWFYLGKPTGEHLMFGASFKVGIYVQFQIRMKAGHRPFFYFSMRGPDVENAHLSPELYNTVFGIKLTPMQLPVIGRAALTPYVAYRALKNADYRFSPMDYASINIGLEIAYGF